MILRSVFESDTIYCQKVQMLTLKCATRGHFQVTLSPHWATEGQNTLWLVHLAPTTLDKLLSTPSMPRRNLMSSIQKEGNRYWHRRILQWTVCVVDSLDKFRSLSVANCCPRLARTLEASCAPWTWTRTERQTCCWLARPCSWATWRERRAGSTSSLSPRYQMSEKCLE